MRTLGKLAINHIYVSVLTYKDYISISEYDLDVYTLQKQYSYKEQYKEGKLLSLWLAEQYVKKMDRQNQA